MVVTRSERSELEVELAVEANLTEATVAEFRGALYAELESHQSRITLDFEKVRNISSSALGAMLLFQRKAREKGKVLAIGHCSDELRRTLLAIRFDRSVEMEGETPPDYKAGTSGPTR